MELLPGFCIWCTGLGILCSENECYEAFSNFFCETFNTISCHELHIISQSKCISCLYWQWFLHWCDMCVCVSMCICLKFLNFFFFGRECEENNWIATIWFVEEQNLEDKHYVFFSTMLVLLGYISDPSTRHSDSVESLQNILSLMPEENTFGSILSGRMQSFSTLTLLTFWDG